MDERMEQEREFIKNQLDAELKHIHFTETSRVIERIHPITWKQKFRAVWDKEIELTVAPISAVFVVLLAVVIYPWHSLNQVEPVQSKERILIQIGGNTYWQDDFEKVVMHYENKNKN